MLALAATASVGAIIVGGIGVAQAMSSDRNDPVVVDDAPVVGEVGTVDPGAPADDPTGGDPATDDPAAPSPESPAPAPSPSPPSPSPQSPSPQQVPPAPPVGVDDDDDDDDTDDDADDADDDADDDLDD